MPWTLSWGLWLLRGGSAICLSCACCAEDLRSTPSPMEKVGMVVHFLFQFWREKRREDLRGLRLAINMIDELQFPVRDVFLQTKATQHNTTTKDLTKPKPKPNKQIKTKIGISRGMMHARVHTHTHPTTITTTNQSKKHCFFLCIC